MPHNCPDIYCVHCTDPVTTTTTTETNPSTIISVSSDPTSNAITTTSLSSPTAEVVTTTEGKNFTRYDASVLRQNNCNVIKAM